MRNLILHQSVKSGYITYIFKGVEANKVYKSVKDFDNIREITDSSLKQKSNTI